LNFASSDLGEGEKVGVEEVLVAVSVTGNDASSVTSCEDLEVDSLSVSYSDRMENSTCSSIEGGFGFTIDTAGGLSLESEGDLIFMAKFKDQLGNLDVEYRFMVVLPTSFVFAEGYEVTLSGDSYFSAGPFKRLVEGVE